MTIFAENPTLFERYINLVDWMCEGPFPCWLRRTYICTWPFSAILRMLSIIIWLVGFLLLIFVGGGTIAMWSFLYEYATYSFSNIKKTVRNAWRCENGRS